MTGAGARRLSAFAKSEDGFGRPLVGPRRDPKAEILDAIG